MICFSSKNFVPSNHLHLWLNTYLRVILYIESFILGGSTLCHTCRKNSNRLIHMYQWILLVFTFSFRLCVQAFKKNCLSCVNCEGTLLFFFSSISFTIYLFSLFLFQMVFKFIVRNYINIQFGSFIWKKPNSIFFHGTATNLGRFLCRFQRELL